VPPLSREQRRRSAPPDLPEGALGWSPGRDPADHCRSRPGTWTLPASEPFHGW